MRTTPLTPRFGLEVRDVDLRGVTAEHGYPEIRALFETHSVLLFCGQRLDDDAQLAFAALFGPLENRAPGAWGEWPEMSMVSNLDRAGRVLPAEDRRVLNLVANQLWHTDSTFLPVPALANVLAARVLPSRGGETEFASTRAAWRDLSPELAERARVAVVRHRYGHSRRKIDAGLAAEQMFTRWPDQVWRAVWPNPVTGEEALYVASHAFAVEGMEPPEGEAFIEELVAHATQPEYVYTHRWRPGDVLVWDERATLHRGRPWPCGEERTLASVCVSARDVDGLDLVRPAPGPRPPVEEVRP